MKLKRLFLSSILLILLVSCSTTENISPILDGGYKLSGMDAVEYYLNSNSDDYRVLYNLAYSYLEAGKYQEALEIAISAEEKYPEYIRFSYLKAYCYKRMNKIDQYIETLSAIYENNPGDSKIAESLISQYLVQKDIENAERVARMLIKQEPKNEIALKALSRNSQFFRDISGYVDKSEELLKNPKLIDDVKQMQTLRLLEPKDLLH